MTPANLVLVTGGAGFLGQHLVERLVADGCQVRVLDRSAPGRWADRLGIDHRVGDVRNHFDVERAVEGSDAVVHAAFASPHQGASEIDSVNVDGTHTVLEATAGCPRVVLVSSTIVERRIVPHPLSSVAPVSRLRRYRDSRVAAEAAVEAAGHDRPGLRTAVARPATFVGPGRVGGFALLFESLRRGWPVPLLGRGDNCYQLLDVRDLAAGLSRLARSPATGRFGFAAKGATTVASDLTALAAHAATGARVHRLPGSVARIALRAGELAGMAPLGDWHHRSARREDHLVDCTRAETELGWCASGGNVDALIGAYDWYVDQAGRGVAATTHPVPVAHRILHRATAAVLRRAR